MNLGMNKLHTCHDTYHSVQVLYYGGSRYLGAFLCMVCTRTVMHVLSVCVVC